MGLTIHFKGKLQDKNQVYTLIDDLTDMAKIMKWECEIMDEDWKQPSTAKLEFMEKGATITGKLSLKGIHINLHPKCEAFSIYFDAEGNLRTPMTMVLLNEGSIKPEAAYTSVKTQFAPPDVHISIIKLLQFLKKRYIPNLYVSDEGEYWESGDKEKLIEKIEFLNEKIDMVSNALSSIEIENAEQYSAEELAKIIEEKLRGKL